VKFQGANKGLMERRVGEDREDILEQNSRGGEVRELAQGTAQSYLKTGEFGGAGGIGGGESDLGGLGESGGKKEKKKMEGKNRMAKSHLISRCPSDLRSRLSRLCVTFFFLFNCLEYLLVVYCYLH
jgi:hypothetical protein